MIKHCGNVTDPMLLLAYNCIIENAAATQGHFSSFDIFANESPEDSILWLRLQEFITTTPMINNPNDLHLAVMLARAGGARLVKSKQFGYRIEPDYKEGIWTKETYAKIQQIFSDNKDDFLMLLKQIDTMKAPEELFK